MLMISTLTGIYSFRASGTNTSQDKLHLLCSYFPGNLAVGGGRDDFLALEFRLGFVRSSRDDLVRVGITDSWQRCQLFLVAELRSTSSCLVLVAACSFFAGSLAGAGLGSCAKLIVERTINAARTTPFGSSFVSYLLLL